MILRCGHCAAFVARLLFHRNGIHRYLAHGQTVQRAVHHVLAVALDHIEIVLFHLAPLAGGNLAICNDKNVHANFRAKHLGLFVIVNGVRVD